MILDMLKNTILEKWTNLRVYRVMKEVIKIGVAVATAVGSNKRTAKTDNNIR